VVYPLQADEAPATAATDAAIGLPARDPTVRRRRRRWPLVSGTILTVFVITGVFAPLLAPHDPEKPELLNNLKPPWFAGGSSDHILGTDVLGRDVLSRLIYGSRVSLLVALSVVVIAGFVGVTVAVVAGYRGGRLDAFLMRTTDASMAFPVLLLAIVIVGVFGPSMTNVIVILAVAGWPSYARVLRSEVLRIKGQDFVTQARAMGGSARWVVLRHVLPNIVPTLLVLASLQVGLSIIAEGSLSFLGIGVPPPAPSWGGMLSDGRKNIVDAWWLPTMPGIALSLVVLSANMMGDWLRVNNDPTTRK
jgi:peptide/nickel transport system permease protein